MSAVSWSSLRRRVLSAAFCRLRPVPLRLWPPRRRRALLVPSGVSPPPQRLSWPVPAAALLTPPATSRKPRRHVELFPDPTCAASRVASARQQSAVAKERGQPPQLTRRSFRQPDSPGHHGPPGGCSASAPELPPRP